MWVAACCHSAALVCSAGLEADRLGFGCLFKDVCYLITSLTFTLCSALARVAMLQSSRVSKADLISSAGLQRLVHLLSSPTDSVAEVAARVLARCCEGRKQVRNLVSRAFSQFSMLRSRPGQLPTRP